MTKIYLKIAFSLLFIGAWSGLFSQNVGINTTGTSPSVNAILDLNSGNTGRNLGLIIPHVALTSTLTQFNPPIRSGATTKDTGMIVYNTNAAVGNGVGYYYWNGNTWMSVSGSGGGGSVGGSGTNNYIAKWTPNGSTLGNSIAYDNGTSIGIGNILPNAEAILDLSNTTNQAFLLPQNSNPATNIITPPSGMLIYNSTTGCYQYSQGGAWQNAWGANIQEDVSAQSGANNNSFSITTTHNNEMVLVFCDGAGTTTFGGSVAITGPSNPTANWEGWYYLANFSTEIWVYWFLAPTAGTYTVTVTETNYTYYYNYGIALYGFCSNTPGFADITNFTGNDEQCNGCQTNTSVTVLGTENTYIVANYVNYWYNAHVGATFPSGVTQLQATNAGGSGDDCELGGTTVTAPVSSVTVSATDDNEHYAILAVLQIQ